MSVSAVGELRTWLELPSVRFVKKTTTFDTGLPFPSTTLALK